MVLPGETFPYKQLTVEDKAFVTSMCGGEPVRDPALVRNFLSMSGLRTLGIDKRLILNQIAWETANTMGHSDRPSMQQINRGFLFYAGVFAEIGHVDEVPFHRDVVHRIVDADARNRAIDGLQRISEEAPSFTDLMADMRLGLENARDNDLYTFSVIGAGVAHMLYTGSIEQTFLDAQSGLYEMETDPELADLAAKFDEAFGSET